MAIHEEVKRLLTPPTLLFVFSHFMLCSLISHSHISFADILLLGNQALRQLYEDKSYSVSDFMGVVLKIHGKYREMVTSVFSSHKDFMSALDRVREGGKALVYGEEPVAMTFNK